MRTRTKAAFLTALCAASALLLSSCLSILSEGGSGWPTKGDTYAQLYEEDPVVLLIMPPINNSSNVDAKDYFYSTLTVPLTEAGYYVLPPYLTLEVLQRESAYDAELFIDKDLSRFKEVLGADVAVFTTIKAWDKSLLDYTVTVKIEYTFKSTKTNEVLYKKNGIVTMDASQSISDGNSLIGTLADMLLSSLSTALVDYVDMAVRCNSRTLSDLPTGKYSPKHGVDKSEYPTNSTITVNLTN